MAESGGSIASALIGAASTYYSQRQAGKLADKASSATSKATKAAQDRQEKMMLEAEQRQIEADKRKSDAQADRDRPVGESATIDFGKQNVKAGSALDFLVPKVGKSQLSGGAKSGLGV